jgi:hypothetical protein
MILIEIALTVLGIAVNQMVAWKCGPLGIVALCLLGIGLKTRSATLILVGLVTLVLLTSPS